MKTNVNIFNALNESFEEEVKIKKQVFMEGDKVTVKKDKPKMLGKNKNSNHKDRVIKVNRDDKKVDESSYMDDFDFDIEALIDKFNENYETLYNAKGEVAGEKEAIAAYDDYLKNEEFKKYVEAYCNHEGDFISSDREAAAFMFAMEDLGYLDKIDGMNEAAPIDKAPTPVTDETTDLDNNEEVTPTEETITEDETVKINQVEVEPDYLINDVTVLDQVGEGDVQAPDIEALLTLVDESLKAEYSNEWGKINILSSKINESNSFALVDITTPEILREFQERGIEDAAIGKNLILESDGKLVEFKVNNLNGTTKYSKKTTNPQQAIYEWLESEFLQEAKEEKAKEAEVIKAKTEKETIENYIENRLDLKMEIENIKMFIDLGKQVGAKEEMKPAIQKRMYAFAAEVPHNIEVKADKDNNYELSFSNLDQVVEMVFGKEWVEEKEEIPEVLELKENEQADSLIKDYYNHKFDLDELHNKLEKLFGNKKDAFEYLANNDDRVKASLNESSLNESYEQFNIGDIEVVFNPETYETLYSIPSADVKDKKINLTKVPTVQTPYDTDTIIKSFIETKFGRISTEEEQKVADNNEEVPVEEVPQEQPTEEVPQEETPVDVNVNIDDEEINEDELPEEPTEGEPQVDLQEPEQEEPQAETGSAVFMKVRPKQHINIEDIRYKAMDGDTPTSSYIVVDTVDLPKEEFENLTSNLNEPKDFLVGIQALDRKNYSFNVVKVTSAGAKYTLLIDPLGYDYPRYVGIEDNTNNVDTVVEEAIEEMKK